MVDDRREEDEDERTPEGTTGALRSARERWSRERGLPPRPEPEAEAPGPLPEPAEAVDPELALALDRLPGERVIWCAHPDRLLWASGELTGAGRFFFLGSRASIVFLATACLAPVALGLLLQARRYYSAYVATTSPTQIGSILAFAPAWLGLVVSAVTGVLGVATMRFHRAKHLFALTTHRAVRLEAGRVLEVVSLDSIAAIEPTPGWERGALVRGIAGSPDLVFFGLRRESVRALEDALAVARPGPPRAAPEAAPPSQTTAALRASHDRRAKGEGRSTRG